MDFLHLQKERLEMKKLADRVDEYARDAGSVYTRIAEEKTRIEILLAAVSLKIKNGEALVDDILSRGKGCHDQRTKKVLEQLSLTVYNEIERLGGIKKTLLEYRVALEQNNAIAKVEMLRKLQVRAHEYMANTTKLGMEKKA